MKKIIFALLFLFSIFLISCNSVENPENNEEPENNEQSNNNEGTVIKDYKITFVNALDVVVKEYTLKEGENVVYPTAIEMRTDGYRFLDSFDKNITVASSDETIKGNYVKTWTVNFYNEYSQLISTQVVDDGEDAESPEVTPREGYMFKGWGADFTNVKSDLEVYGNYDVITYNLKYTSNIEDSILCNVENDSQVVHNKTVSIMANNVKGYSFLGFYENGELITEDTLYSFKITEDRVISAEYVKVDIEIFVEDGVSFVYFGNYPQTLLEDAKIINALNQLEPDEAGYIDYNGKTYYKTTAKITAIYGGTVKSRSGTTTITNGQQYYFIVEPIKWRIINTGPNAYELLAEYTLDAGAFYAGIVTEESEDPDLDREIDGETIFGNNYEYSDVRKFLNEVFYNVAFSNTEKQIIKTTLVDNSSKTGLDFNSDMDPTAYICDNTNDKVYLISYKDYNENEKIKKLSEATDFALARGCWLQYGSSSYDSLWWFRTPNPAYQDCWWFKYMALVGDDLEQFDWNYYVHYDYVGYKPAMRIAK